MRSHRLLQGTQQFNLLGDDGKPSLFAPIMLATLSTCAQLERDNITFRLQSGRKQYIAKGGKLGRKPGSKKSADQKKEEYKEAISLLKKGMPSGMWQSWREKASALFNDWRRSFVDDTFQTYQCLRVSSQIVLAQISDKRQGKGKVKTAFWCERCKNRLLHLI